MIRRPPRSTLDRSSAASDVYKRQFLTINALVGPDEDLDEAVRGLSEALAARLATAPSQPFAPFVRASLRYPMTRAMWDEMIGHATTAIGDGAIEKVVLARVCEVRAEDTIDAAAPLAALDAHYGDSFRFLFEPCPHPAFLGATPALPVAVPGRAVAGP